jgi:hypothetical protein
MRCDQCNKFAAYDDSTEPEVDLNFNTDTGDITAQVRIVLTHDECGQELKEASFDFEETVPEDVMAAHRGEGHELDLESDDSELTSRYEGKGRYTKTFYGARLEVSLTCSCNSIDDPVWSYEFADDVQASHMDELV